jgi:hypothetical protein
VESEEEAKAGVGVDDGVEDGIDHDKLKFCLSVLIQTALLHSRFI